MASAANAGGGVLMAAADQYVYSSETISSLVGDGGMLKPIINGAIGHLAKRYAPNVGAGIVGVAGYQLGQVLFDASDAQGFDAGAMHRRNVHHRRYDTGVTFDVDAGAMRGDPSARVGRPVLASRVSAPFDVGAIFDPAYT